MLGGRAGGKSVFIARKIIYRMQSDGRNNAVVFRLNEKDNFNSSYSELKKAINAFADLVYESAIELYISKGESLYNAKKKAELDKANYLGLWKFNTSPLKITYLPCGNKIIFRGFNEPESIKSITTDTGFFTMAWLEEAQQVMNKQDFDDVDKSFRGKIPDDLYFEWLISFNSPLNTHWLRDMCEDASIKVNFPKNRYITEGFDNYTYKSISLKKGENKLAIAHYSVYKDNPYLTQTDIERYELAKKNNPQHFEWEMLGEFGSTSGKVFNNYSILDFNIQEVIKPKSWRERSKFRIVGGLDFGYVHPWAFYMMAINTETKELYIFDGFSGAGLKNSEVAGRIISMGYGKERIVCENAEPRTIQDLKDIGLRGLKSVKKYKGNSDSSIMQGIKLMMEYRIYIKPELTAMIRSFANYVWDTDKYGNSLERPIDVGDDEVVTARYVVMWAEKQGWGFGYDI